MAKVEKFQDKRGDHRIRVKADNGRIIYSSTEGYKKKSAAVLAAIAASKALLKEFTSYLDK